METIYVVTGATGFIGCNLIPKLTGMGKTVHALARSEQKAQQALGKTDARIFYGDVRDKAAVEQMFCQKDAEYVLIHAAAIILISGSKRDYRHMYDVNIGGLENAIEVCIQHNAKLLHVSSVHAIEELKQPQVIVETTDFHPGRVKGKYAKTKAMGSAMVMDAIRNRGLQAVMVHPSGVTGPNDYGNSLLTQMVLDYRSNKIPAAVKGGYDFVDVRDVADGIIAAIEHFKNGERYLLTNRYYSVKEILDILYELTGHKQIRSVLPIWVAKLGLPFLFLWAKLRRRRPLYTGYSLYTLSSNSNFSNAHAKADLGFSPRDLKESLRDTLQFLSLEKSK